MQTELNVNGNRTEVLAQVNEKVAAGPDQTKVGSLLGAAFDCAPSGASVSGTVTITEERISFYLNVHAA